MLHYPDETKKQIKKYLLVFMVLSCIALYAIYTLILAPIYTAVSTNVLFIGGWLPFVIRILLEIIDIAIFAVVYFSIIYAFLRMSPKNIAIFPILYLLLNLLRCSMSLLTEYLTSGYVGSDSYISQGTYYILDLISLTLILIIATVLRIVCAIYIKIYKKVRVAPPHFIPFTKVFDIKNPIQICSLLIAGIVSFLKICTRIISDIFYGAPASIAEGLVMVAYYLSDLLNGLIFYAMFWFLFAHMNKIENRLIEKQAVSD